jgi:hypothetical protein
MYFQSKTKDAKLEFFYFDAKIVKQNNAKKVFVEAKQKLEAKVNSFVTFEAKKVFPFIRFEAKNILVEV